MSGGDRSSGGGSSGGAPEWSCLSLVKRVALNSPVPAVVASLHVSQVLELVRVPSTTGGFGRIEAQTNTGVTAGSITFDGVRRLWDCMERGHRYDATVTEMPVGGRCVVELRHV